MLSAAHTEEEDKHFNIFIFFFVMDVHYYIKILNDDSNFAITLFICILFILVGALWKTLPRGPTICWSSPADQCPSIGRSEDTQCTGCCCCCLLRSPFNVLVSPFWTMFLQAGVFTSTQQCLSVEHTFVREFDATLRQVWSLCSSSRAPAEH